MCVAQTLFVAPAVYLPVSPIFSGEGRGGDEKYVNAKKNCSEKTLCIYSNSQETCEALR